MLSIQPGAARPAGTACNDDQVAQLVTNILANLPALLSREDASVARDPFAPLSTGKLPHKTLADKHGCEAGMCMSCRVLHACGLHCDVTLAIVWARDDVATN